jgi:hypothetical protein
MKVNNTFAGFEQFALSTQEVAMVKGGNRDLTGDLIGGGDLGGGSGGGYELQKICVVISFANGTSTTKEYSCQLDANQCIACYNDSPTGRLNPASQTGTC